MISVIFAHSHRADVFSSVHFSRKSGFNVLFDAMKRGLIIIFMSGVNCYSPLSDQPCKDLYTKSGSTCIWGILASF